MLICQPALHPPVEARRRAPELFGAAVSVTDTMVHVAGASPTSAASTLHTASVLVAKSATSPFRKKAKRTPPTGCTSAEVVVEGVEAAGTAVPVDGAAPEEPAGGVPAPEVPPPVVLPVEGALLLLSVPPVLGGTSAVSWSAGQDQIFVEKS